MVEDLLLLADIDLSFNLFAFNHFYFILLLLLLFQPRVTTSYEVFLRKGVLELVGHSK